MRRGQLILTEMALSVVVSVIVRERHPDVIKRIVSIANVNFILYTQQRDK